MRSTLYRRQNDYMPDQETLIGWIHDWKRKKQIKKISLDRLKWFSRLLEGELVMSHVSMFSHFLTREFWVNFKGLLFLFFAYYIQLSDVTSLGLFHEVKGIKAQKIQNFIFPCVRCKSVGSYAEELSPALPCKLSSLILVPNNLDH